MIPYCPGPHELSVHPCIHCHIAHCVYGLVCGDEASWAP
ncbi:unnamed protein product [Staurois parvus]|uniref:Uncharacterized protein n=1 Tax=Staurois parvus TaxID=386267 RepID=A0ABN9D670_9NEOB|nr:unnamed protein product [Staurois parvus]